MNVVTDDFVFTIWYFKPSGKLHLTAEARWRTEEAHGGGPNMHQAAARLRGLRDNGGPGALPGLSTLTDGWDGIIVVHHPQGGPVMLLKR